MKNLKLYRTDNEIQGNITFHNAFKGADVVIKFGFNSISDEEYEVISQSKAFQHYLTSNSNPKIELLNKPDVKPAVKEEVPAKKPK